MEIELNFRLDRDGRTSNPNQSEEGGPSQQETAQMDYQSKVMMTNLAAPYDEIQRQLLDDLLFDCEISDCGLLPRTFWVPADGSAPRCTLEQFALNIFHQHVPSDVKYDPKNSGAEWWVQLRPSPEGTGRYSMHDDKPDEISKTGISFHWDKDEDLRILTGGTTYVHPHISTVTYLTDYGSPTLAVNCRVHNLSGEYIIPGENADNSSDDHVEGFVSWPKAGKHLSFDGRYLHAALPNLMEPGMFDQQIAFNESKDPKQQKLFKRRHRRVTFLVNIWLNYHPFEVKPFPETMIDKLSGEKEVDRKQLSFEQETSCGATKCRRVTVSCDSVTQDGSSDETYTPEKMTWAMGDCNSPEKLEAMIPLAAIRSEASNGGNVIIEWAKTTSDDVSFRLYEVATKRAECNGEEEKKRASEAVEAEEPSKRARPDE
jgi:hypothetical protein